MSNSKNLYNGTFIKDYEREYSPVDRFNNSKNYVNRFFDTTENVDSHKKISLDPDSLHKIKKENIGFPLLGNTNGSSYTDIYSQKYISYINIDSRMRNRHHQCTYTSEIYNLPPHPIMFTHGSSSIKVCFPNHPFHPADKITLNNIISKNLMLKNVISVKKNSSYLKILHQNHGLSLHNLDKKLNLETDFERVDYVESICVPYDDTSIIPDSKQFYISKYNKSINLSIQLYGIDRQNISNIPLSYLNKKHQVYLLFSAWGNDSIELDRHSYVIKLSTKSSHNYSEVHDSHHHHMTCIKYNCLFGIPLDFINSPSEHNFTIHSTTPDYFVIDLGCPAIVDPDENFHAEIDGISTDISELHNRGGGTQSYLRLVKNFTEGFSNSHSYKVNLDRTYRNVIEAKIVGSTFPNYQKIIKSSEKCTTNNKLYWKNISDGDHIYTLRVQLGNYDITQLAHQIEKKFNKTPRIFYSELSTQYDSDGFYKYHLVTVNVKPETNVVKFSSYRKFLRHRRSVIKIFSNMIDIIYSPDIPIKSSDIVYIYLTETDYSDYNFHDCLYTRGSNTSIHKIDTKTKILINFFNTQTSRSEICSINTTTCLENFTFNEIIGIVYLPNHQLSVGDLIITDQFGGTVAFYQVTAVNDQSSFKIRRCKEIKFIYRGMIFDDHGFIKISQNLIKNLIPNVGTHYICHITHPKHNLEPRIKIKIDGRAHRINRIIDLDHYEILLDISENISVSDHLVSITYPDIFQLLFNYEDTLGPYLSFENCADKNSITPFASKIRNTDSYDMEDRVRTHHRELFNRRPYDYFYIVCPELNTGVEYYRNTHQIENVFAQIRWFYNEYGGIVFDSFVRTKKICYSPIDVLRELHIFIVHPDGIPVDFGGLDHSFTIKIVEIFNQPSLTDISARINAEILPRRV